MECPPMRVWARPRVEEHVSLTHWAAMLLDMSLIRLRSCASRHRMEAMRHRPEAYRGKALVVCLLPAATAATGARVLTMFYSYCTWQPRWTSVLAVKWGWLDLPARKLVVCAPWTGGAPVDRAPGDRCAENFDEIQGSIEDDLLDLDASDLDVHIDDRHSALDDEAFADAFYDFDDAPTVASDVRRPRARALSSSSSALSPPRTPCLLHTRVCLRLSVSAAR